jgi:hypothetical protein
MYDLFLDCLSPYHCLHLHCLPDWNRSGYSAGTGGNMKNLLLIIITSLFFNCAGIFNPDRGLHGIEWCELSGKTFSTEEDQNIYQRLKVTMRFGYGDTIYMTKMYWNPKDSTFPPWYRYFRCPVFNKHWEIPPPITEDNDTNLVFTYKCKEYADARYQQPVMDNSNLVEWFVWKEVNNTLFMGYVEELTRKTYYWEWYRE